MSGGSWNYLCFKVEDAARDLIRSKCPKRRAFGLHLKLVAEALHDIEWVDSADKSQGDEFEAIMKCIGKSDVLDFVLQDAKQIYQELGQLLNDIAGEK